MDYNELIARLRTRAECFDYDGWSDIACDLEEAAATIDDLAKSYNKETRNSQSGEWVHKNAIAMNTWIDRVECSYCKQMAFYQQGLGYLKTNFCPHCGAKMIKDNT
jgi:hypothetical protein